MAQPLFRIYGQCPICKSFSIDHPSFASDKFLKIRFLKNGKFRHTTQAGKAFHKYVIKNKGETDD